MRGVIALQRPNTSPGLPGDDTSYVVSYAKVFAEDTFSPEDSGGACIANGGTGWNGAWTRNESPKLVAEMSFEEFSINQKPTFYFSGLGLWKFYLFIQDGFGWSNQIYATLGPHEYPTLKAIDNFETYSTQDPIVFIPYGGYGWAYRWQISGLIEALVALDDFSEYSLEYTQPGCDNYFARPCWNSQLNQGNGFIGSWLCRFNWLGKCEDDDDDGGCL